MNLPFKTEKFRLFGDIYKNTKWTIDVLHDYKIKTYIYIFMLVFQTLYAIILTTRIGNIVDLALADDARQLITTGTIMICLYTGNIIISILCNRYSARIYNGMYNELELKVYRKIMSASWEELTEYHSGDLITRLSTDIKTVSGNAGGLVPTIVAKVAMIIFSGIYIIYLDYSMIMVAIVIAPLLVVTSRVFMGRIFEAQKKIREVESRINSYNKETFNNIQAVKAFDLGDVFYNKMDELEKYRKYVDLKSNTFSLLSWGTSYFMGTIAACVCISWMFYRVHSGVISFGYLSVLAFLAVQIGMTGKTMLSLIPTVMEFIASCERVRKLLELSDEKDDVENVEMAGFTEEGEKAGVTVNIENMYFKYRNGYSVFEGADLCAKPGEIISLVGPSGEGKTTMLRIILGIVNALSGRVCASVPGRAVNLGKQTRSIISYVPQGNTMMAGSIIENMRLVKQNATENEIKEALETACIYDFIEKLPGGLAYMLGENGLGLSEGQNQRLSIARALLKDSPVLLMDEATSALDVATERRVLSNILKKNPKKTIILTTHRPTVLSMCDRVYKIADKKVCVIGQEDIQQLMDEF